MKKSSITLPLAHRDVFKDFFYSGAEFKGFEDLLDEVIADLNEQFSEDKWIERVWPKPKIYIVHYNIFGQTPMDIHRYKNNAIE